MIYDVVVVGGGASGLTAAAYLAKNGHSILLLEKEPRCGGLVNSFTYGEYTFDGGIRALENAGALFPMLKQLGIEIEFIKNRVSLGIEDRVIEIESDKSFTDYEKLLKDLYPESSGEISVIIEEIKQITRYLDIQYGINNPLFLDIKTDRDYFLRKVIPWMFKYTVTAPKITSKNNPVVSYLRKYTSNQSLLDIIAQHFFTDTPAYFALSYFRLYQDYYYPRNGTGVFSQKLVDFIIAHGGEIRTSAAVIALDPTLKIVKTEGNDEIQYRQLLWAADQKTLYRMIDTQNMVDQSTKVAVEEKRALLADKVGNNSVLTLYLGCNLDKSYFEEIATAHFFYTPHREGISKAGDAPLGGTWQDMKDWCDRFFEFNTYEISIPALRNSSLAPKGKTGLIISLLFDYPLMKYIYDQGWEGAFRDYVGTLMIDVLDRSIYPGLAASVGDSFLSTPITLHTRTGSTDGAITGWSFTNHPMPAENRLVKISNSVKTGLPNIAQAGQWTYSPSGFPVALITGKLAADTIGKRLK